MATAGNASAADGEVEACPNTSVLVEDAVFLGFSPEAAQAPECRGYELVSPPYKEGFPIEGVEAISPDGDRVIAGSFGAFAGDESDRATLGELPPNIYELVREGAGWVASALNPSAARFESSSFVGTSGDLIRTLWSVQESSHQVPELYVREADGVLVGVGSMAPESAGGAQVITARVDGASHGLSRVLLSEEAPLVWKGDGTVGGRRSLYEYSGTGRGEPALVGVRNEGPPPWKSGAEYLNEGAELVSDCGTWLGSMGESDRHDAVSADGETVFFTSDAKEAGCSGPQVNELYARTGNVKTVPISEPEEEQCKECRTDHTKITTTEEPAEFEGASEDGSKAFFTTTQELLPGTEGSNLYEYDSDAEAGEKVVRITTGAPNPQFVGVVAISADGSHVYFVARAKLAEANDEGREPAPGQPNLYVYERDAVHPEGRTAFVATLSAEDSPDWEQWDGGNEDRVQVTPDGRFLVFASKADLTASDTSTVRQLFEYDAVQERLVRVSVGQGGYNNDGNVKGKTAEAEADEPLLPTSPPSLAFPAGAGLGISEDGSEVFFESSDGLTPGALDNAQLEAAGAYYAENVYEYRSAVADGGSIADANVTLISDGRDLTVERSGFIPGTHLYGTDASDQDVFFSSGVPLVGQDTDTQIDLYDARVDGGFPQPAATAGCVSEEGCLGAEAMAPSFGAALSSSTVAGGNLAPRPAEVQVNKPKSKPLTRAQKLARALRACAKQRLRKKRAECQARAKSTYGAHKKSRRTHGRRSATARGAAARMVADVTAKA